MTKQWKIDPESGRWKCPDCLCHCVSIKDHQEKGCLEFIKMLNMFKDKKG